MMCVGFPSCGEIDRFFAAVTGSQRRPVGCEVVMLEVGGRTVYDGYIIEDIYCQEGEEYISFTGAGDNVPLGQAIGEVDQDTPSGQGRLKSAGELLEIAVLSYGFLESEIG